MENKKRKEIKDEKQNLLKEIEDKAAEIEKQTSVINEWIKKYKEKVSECHLLSKTHADLSIEHEKDRKMFEIETNINRKKIKNLKNQVKLLGRQDLVESKDEEVGETNGTDSQEEVKSDVKNESNIEETKKDTTNLKATTEDKKDIQTNDNVSLKIVEERNDLEKHDDAKLTVEKKGDLTKRIYSKVHKQRKEAAKEGRKPPNSSRAETSNSAIQQSNSYDSYYATTYRERFHRYQQNQYHSSNRMYSHRSYSGYFGQGFNSYYNDGFGNYHY